MEKEELYKIRSASGCITAAWNWSCAQLGHVFRRTWLPVTLFALFAAIGRVLCYEQSQTYSDSVLLQAGTIVCAVALFVSCAWSLSRLFQLLNGHTLKYNFKRCALALLMTCLLFTVIAFAVYGITLLAGCQWWVILAAAFILVLLTLPVHYHHIRYVEEEGLNYFSSAPTSLRRGYRDYGKMAATTLLSAFILLIITVLLAAPQILTYLASSASSTGTMAGDPSGMPDTFVWLLGAVTFLSVWGIFYAWQYLTVVNVYLYGSMEELHQERLSTLRNQEQNG